MKKYAYAIIVLFLVFFYKDSFAYNNVSNTATITLGTSAYGYAYHLLCDPSLYDDNRYYYNGITSSFSTSTFTSYNSGSSYCQTSSGNLYSSMGYPLSIVVSFSSPTTFAIYNSSNGNYVLLYYQSGVWSNSYVPDTSSRIDSFTYSTSTQTANIQGYFKATSTSLFDRLTFWQSSTLVGQENYNYLDATTTGNFNVTYPINIYTSTSTGTTTQPIGVDYTLYAYIQAIDNTNYTITEIASSSINIVASSTILNLEDILNYPEYECSITSITGCFKNALVWAFYPTASSLQSYDTFLDLIKTKAPIGYFYVVKDSLTGLNASSTPTFNITIPEHLKNTFFDPIDLAISSILWIYYIVFLYKRIKHLQI